MNPLWVGNVISVIGGKIEVALRDDIKDMYLNYNGSLYYIGQIGSYVVIPVAYEKIVGIVSQIRLEDIGFKKEALTGKDVDIKQRKVMYVQLVGKISEKRFERGVGTYPLIGDEVLLASDDDFQAIFSTKKEDNTFVIGKFSQNERFDVKVDVDEFFTKHIAVLGTTGAGKSCTIAKIVEEILKFKDTHIVLLDLHGEYLNNFKEKSVVITGDDLELPYWLLNFEELQDICIDRREQSAHNQVIIFKEAILNAKRNSINKDLSDLVSTFTIDTPVYFDVNEVVASIKEKNEEMVTGSSGKDKQGPFYGQFTRFLTRLESKINDQRYSFMFKPKIYTESHKLEDLMRKILGRVKNNYRNITIFDLSGIPFEIRDVVVSLLSRLIFEFNFWNKGRDKSPLLVIYEEAHNYIPRNYNTSAKVSVERIAKEGRKYGVSLMVVSQRPAELSETVLSQCNSYINLRITNPDDQNYIKGLVSDQNAELMDMLPDLRRGEALVIGEGIVMPMRVIISLPNDTPQSADMQFYKYWNDGIKDLDVKSIIDRWWKQAKAID
ncbi:MAG: hypothetical protein DDT22_01067 [candidate division WS2 bacterium]|nr:hypothetical protein [Candidatus Lithacetigena glycinireducens]